MGLDFVAPFLTLYRALEVYKVRPINPKSAILAHSIRLLWDPFRHGSFWTSGLTFLTSMISGAVLGCDNCKLGQSNGEELQTPCSRTCLCTSDSFGTAAVVALAFPVPESDET